MARHVPTSELTPLPALPIGFYRHYKGDLYQVVAVGADADSHDIHVVYWSLPQRRFWVRGYENFCATVTHEGSQVLRFEFLGATVGMVDPSALAPGFVVTR